MLVLEIREGSHVRELSFTRHTLSVGKRMPTLSLGRTPELDTDVEAGETDTRNLVLYERDGRPWLATCRELVIDGERHVGCDAPLRVGSVVSITGATLHLHHFLPIAPANVEVIERELLEMMTGDPCDVGARLVYADALEEAGWLIRAEYLRVQVRLVMHTALDGDEQVHGRLLMKVAPARVWLKMVDEPQLAIACESAAGRACPVRWGSSFAPSICHRCQRAVHFASADPSL